MTNQLRTGFTVNGNALPDHDRLVSWVANARPTTMLVMDGKPLALELYVMAQGDTKVGHRQYDPAEGAEWKTKSATQYVNEVTSQLDPRLYVQVLNEPAINAADLPFLLYWLMDVMDELYNRGYRGIIGNFPMGQINARSLTAQNFNAIIAAELRENPDNTIAQAYAATVTAQADGRVYLDAPLPFGMVKAQHVEDGLFDDFLRHYNQYRGWHVIGIHEYTAITRYFGVGQWPFFAATPTEYFLNPANHTPDKWPTKEDLPCVRINGVLPPYWHVKRADWLTIRAREIGIPEAPEYWVTESGYDNMQDVAEVFPALVDKWGIAPNYDNLRGFNSLANVWGAYWGTEWTFDMAAFEQEKWLHEQCYPVNYIGWNNFMWCSNEWRRDGFDMSQNLQFQSLLVDYAIELRTPPGPDPEPMPDPPPEPPLTLPEWLRVIGLAFGLCVISLILIVGGIIVLSNWKQIHASSLAFGGSNMETLQIMPVDEAGQVLLAAIMAIIAGGMASPVTVPIVNLVKFIMAKVGWEKAVSGNVLAAIVAAVVTVVIWVARWAGVELQVNNVLDLLQTVIPPVVTFLGLFAGQKSLFSWAVRKEVPVVGYQRTKE
jgi:hypothetical protein